MAKLTVRDIFETRRHLVRFENYARRHMENLIIAEPNEAIVNARKLLADNVETFDECDVSELTRDTTDIQEDLKRAKQNRDYWKNRLQNEESSLANLNDEISDLDTDEEDYDDILVGLEDDIEWRTENVEYAKESATRYKKDVKRLKKQLK